MNVECLLSLHGLVGDMYAVGGLQGHCFGGNLMLYLILLLLE